MLYIPQKQKTKNQDYKSALTSRLADVAKYKLKSRQRTVAPTMYTSFLRRLDVTSATVALASPDNK